MSRSSKQQENDCEQIIEEIIKLDNGKQQKKLYSKGRFLGKGGFARCYQFQSYDEKRIYAAKVISKQNLIRSRAKQKLMSEIRIHRGLVHTNIVKFEHFFEDQENVYIMLELCPNQSLSELLRRRKRLTELEVQCYLLQVISAIKYVHSHKVIHRDLKLSNLFLSDRLEIKLGDFGLSAKLEYEGQKRKTICGTPNYIAPEVLEGKIGHSYEVDIWSLGIVMYTLLIGKPPFESQNVQQTYDRIRMNAYSFPSDVEISEEAVSLITQILRKESYRRPTLDEILEHEFFHMGYAIPKLLPISTMAVPPSESYLQQFIGKARQPAIIPTSDTAPIRIDLLQAKQNNLINTQKLLRQEILPDQQSSESVIGEVWVKKWVDYSSKYGVGYLLSNGSAGVYFNDSSKIIIEPDQGHFFYLQRNSQKQDIAQVFTMYDYPKEIHKKLTLLQHFRSYLETDQVTLHSYEQGDYSIDNPPPYVKKWVRTRRAILFRLSNKIVQVNFQDQTEVILSSETRMTTYVNKKGERITLPLTVAMQSTNQEMTKRLRYTKEILNCMLNGPPNAQEFRN